MTVKSQMRGVSGEYCGSATEVELPQQGKWLKYSEKHTQPGK